MPVGLTMLMIASPSANAKVKNTPIAASSFTRLLRST